MKRTKVKNLAKQIRGVSYKPEDLHDSLDEDSVILLRANNIDEGKINFDDVVYVDKSKVSDEQYLKVGDVLICASSGSKQLVGKAASVVFDSPCTFGAFCKVVRPNNNVADYLGKYFQSGVYRRKISEVAIGANINNIRNEHIDSLELPIYEPAQAQRIVEKIGLLQNIIDNRKCELSKLDELIKARFVEMFGDPISNDKGWNTDPLTAVCSRIYGGGTPSKSHPEYFKGSIPWVSPKDMKSDVITDSIDHITKEAIANSTTNLVPKGSVLMVIRSGILKHDLPVSINAVPVTINQDMNAAKEAFAEYLNNTSLDSRQIYFVNQIVEYIVHNGMMKDLSVLQEAPFNAMGSVVEIFTDLSVWMGIRSAIERVNANALAV